MECAYCVTIVLICLNVFLNFVTRSFSLVSKLFIDGIVALVFATKTMIGGDGPSSCCDVVDKWLIFCYFHVEGLCGKSIIIVCKFYELYCKVWCRGFWWRVVRVAYDASYVGSKLGIVVASLCIVSAW